MSACEIFATPDPDFDPSTAKQDFSKEIGVLSGEDGVEENVDEAIRKAVAEWEELVSRKATEKERADIAQKIRKLYSGDWLDGARTQLEGKATAPIEWFDQLIQEHGLAAYYISHRAMVNLREKKNSQATISNLRNKILELEKADAISKEKWQSEINRLKEENENIRKESAGAERTASKDQYERNEFLESQLRESREREKNLKLQYRELEDNNEELHRIIEKGVLNPGSDDGSRPSAAAPGEFDTLKILREIKEASDTHKELSKESEDLIARWMDRVADDRNLVEYNIAVCDIRNKLGALQQHVLALYEKLGFEEEEVSAEDAIATITRRLDELPNDDLAIRMHNIRLTMDNSAKAVELQTEKLRSDELRMKLELAKSDEQLLAETRMAYNIYETKEVEKRVEARTQMYQQHRVDLVTHIFAGWNEFLKIARSCPDEQTRKAIDEAREKYLSPSSLPGPKTQLLL